MDGRHSSARGSDPSTTGSPFVFSMVSGLASDLKVGRLAAYAESAIRIAETVLNAGRMIEGHQRLAELQSLDAPSR